MRSTFQNTGTALSIGIFFSLMIGGLSGSLSSSLGDGLRRHEVEAGVAHHISGLPPVPSLFAAFLGVNPIHHLLVIEGALDSLTAGSRALLTGKHFFPELIAAPFHDGLVVVFAVAAALAVVAGAASWQRGAAPLKAIVKGETR